LKPETYFTAKSKKVKVKARSSSRRLPFTFLLSPDFEDVLIADYCPGVGVAAGGVSVVVVVAGALRRPRRPRRPRPRVVVPLPASVDAAAPLPPPAASLLPLNVNARDSPRTLWILRLLPLCHARVEMIVAGSVSPKRIESAV
jgi:hypothetical protein